MAFQTRHLHCIRFVPSNARFKFAEQRSAPNLFLPSWPQPIVTARPQPRRCRRRDTGCLGHPVPGGVTRILIIDDEPRTPPAAVAPATGTAEAVRELISTSGRPESQGRWRLRPVVHEYQIATPLPGDGCGEGPRSESAASHRIHPRCASSSPEWRSCCTAPGGYR